MPRSKPRIWWCIKAEFGKLPWTTRTHRRDSIHAILEECRNAPNWQALRHDGYRAVKIRVEEVDAE